MTSMQLTKGFLPLSQNAFNNLRFAHICALLEIIGMNQINEMVHIRRLFNERAKGFGEVVSFLTELDMISSDGHTMRLKVDWLGTDSKKGRRDEIIRRLLEKRNRYRTEMFRFINQFNLIQIKLVYSPLDQRRSSESAVRNFLIDIGVVKHEMESDSYILLPEHMNLLVSARNNVNHISPVFLQKNVEARTEIGDAAEELIVKYERERLGPDHSDKVDHVSMRNSAAGYDILSITNEPDGLVNPRFIEVKAVSPVTFQFYWSKNEVAIARTLSAWYFLYLLPVNRDGKFNIDKLMVIPDPCKTVLLNDSNWATETDALICHIKRTDLI